MKATRERARSSIELTTSGRAVKQRNWLLVGLLRFAPAARRSLRLFLSDAISAGRAPSLKPPSRHPLSKSRTSISLTRSTRRAWINRIQAAKPDPDKTDVQLPDEKKSFDKLLAGSSRQRRHARRHAAMSCRIKPKVDQTNANSDHQRNRTHTGADCSRRIRTRRASNLFSTTHAASGRPQPALTGTELATSTTIKRPNIITANSRATARDRIAARAGFQRSGFSCSRRKARSVPARQASHAGRSAFRIRQRGFASERDRRNCKSWAR